MYRLVTSHLP